MNIVVFVLRTGTCKMWREAIVLGGSPQSFQTAGCGMSEAAAWAGGTRKTVRKPPSTATGV